MPILASIAMNWPGWASSRWRPIYSGDPFRELGLAFAEWRICWRRRNVLLTLSYRRRYFGTQWLRRLVSLSNGRNKSANGHSVSSRQRPLLADNGRTDKRRRQTDDAWGTGGFKMKCNTGVNVLRLEVWSPGRARAPQRFPRTSRP